MADWDNFRDGLSRALHDQVAAVRAQAEAAKKDTDALLSQQADLEAQLRKLAGVDIGAAQRIDGIISALSDLSQQIASVDFQARRAFAVASLSVMWSPLISLGLAALAASNSSRIARWVAWNTALLSEFGDSLGAVAKADSVDPLISSSLASLSSWQKLVRDFLEVSRGSELNA